MPPREYRSRDAVEQELPSNEDDRSTELAPHLEPFPLSPEAAGIPPLPEAEPFAAKRRR